MSGWMYAPITARSTRPPQTRNVGSNTTHTMPRMNQDGWRSIAGVKVSAETYRDLFAAIDDLEPDEYSSTYHVNRMIDESLSRYLAETFD